jgi:hypothetical protein
MKTFPLLAAKKEKDLFNRPFWDFENVSILLSELRGEKNPAHESKNQIMAQKTDGRYRRLTGVPLSNFSWVVTKV